MPKLVAGDDVEAVLQSVGLCKSRAEWLSGDLRQIFDVLPTLVFIAEDRECRSVYGNRAAELLVRAPSGANLSKSADAVAIPRDFLVYDADGQCLSPENMPVQRVAREGIEMLGYEFELRFSDGESVWLFGNACPLRDGDGNIWGAVGAFVDISHRKQVEAEMSRVKEQFMAAMEAALDGFVIYRPVRDQAGKIVDFSFVYANPITLSFANTTLDELVGTRLLSRFPGAGAPGGLMDHFSQVVETGIAQEFIVHYSDGAFSGSFRDKVVKVGEDIAVTFTEVTDELKARQAEERLARAKQEFFASASHDLRQPLQSLRLFVDVINQVNKDPLVGRAVQGACQALDSAEALVHSLLDIARIESGVTAFQPQRVELGPLLTRLGTEYESLAKSKGLSFRTYARALPVISDPQALERILRNLITNALRYTEKGGILVGVRRRGIWAVVEVWDSGRGMAADQLENIWDEFVQLHNSARDRDLGLGLGLAIVRKLAGVLGHRLSVQSRPGVGTVFRVFLRM